MEGVCAPSLATFCVVDPVGVGHLRLIIHARGTSATLPQRARGRRSTPAPHAYVRVPDVAGADRKVAPVLAADSKCAVTALILFVADKPLSPALTPPPVQSRGAYIVAAPHMMSVSRCMPLRRRGKPCRGSMCGIRQPRGVGRPGGRGRVVVAAPCQTDIAANNNQLNASTGTWRDEATRAAGATDALCCLLTRWRGGRLAAPAAW